MSDDLGGKPTPVAHLVGERYAPQLVDNRKLLMFVNLHDFGEGGIRSRRTAFINNLQPLSIPPITRNAQNLSIRYKPRYTGSRSSDPWHSSH